MQKHLCPVRAMGFVLALLLAVPTVGLAKKPPKPVGSPDLAGIGIELKEKMQGTTMTVLNAKLTVVNQGKGEAKNSTVEFYLSSDTTLSTDTALTSDTDTMFKSVALGTVKANKDKTRTLGGGLLKPYKPSGKYIIAVLDSTNVLEESDETNNTVVSEQLP